MKSSFWRDNRRPTNTFHFIDHVLNNVLLFLEHKQINETLFVQNMNDDDEVFYLDDESSAPMRKNCVLKSPLHLDKVTERRSRTKRMEQDTIIKTPPSLDDLLDMDDRDKPTNNDDQLDNENDDDDDDDDDSTRLSTDDVKPAKAKKSSKKNGKLYRLFSGKDACDDRNRSINGSASISDPRFDVFRAMCHENVIE
jgi:hypothetical protein